ncbi:MAG: MBL fold metallo-hydrolase [Clostridiales bacterium]|nr:MBL fold metallo-hydrolase [Clostridiales bacterium]
MKRIIFTLITLLCLVGCNNTNIVIENNKIEEKKPDEMIENKDTTVLEEPLEIHFIDVGQADCILVKSNEEAMLIDAGNNDDADLIKSYLKNQNIKELEYVIGTHPHEDHIGSLDIVINNFDIKNVIMPKKATTTKTFEDVVKAIENKKLTITLPKTGDKYNIGDAEFTILSPVKEDYGSNLNNYSVAILLTYGENKFIFTGDAEKEVEEDILDTKINIDADLMKMGHHGSTTSNAEEFLDKISPKIAVITCGVDNSYGHPHQEILDTLINRNVETYRTDLQGNIIVTSDGKNIEIKTEKNTVIETEKETDNTYVLNTNSKVFHEKTCDSVSKMSEKNKKEYTGKREDIIQQGYKACGICRP